MSLPDLSALRSSSATQESAYVGITSHNLEGIGNVLSTLAPAKNSSKAHGFCWAGFVKFCRSICAWLAKAFECLKAAFATKPEKSKKDEGVERKKMKGEILFERLLKRLDTLCGVMGDPKLGEEAVYKAIDHLSLPAYLRYLCQRQYDSATFHPYILREEVQKCLSVYAFVSALQEKKEWKEAFDKMPQAIRQQWIDVAILALPEKRFMCRAAVAHMPRSEMFDLYCTRESASAQKVLSKIASKMLKLPSYPDFLASLKKNEVNEAFASSLILFSSEKA